MGYNKIPLALRYNDTTNNAEGLIEFQLNLSDVGDVCSSTPSQGQGLVWSGGSDGSWCPSTLPAGGGGGTPTLPTGDPGNLLINTGGTTYLASAASDAGIMQLDPYFDANDEGAVAQWDGTKLEVAFPDQLYMLVEAGESIAKGDVVYVTGDAGNGRFIVAKANASDSTKMPAVGLAPAAITFGTNGKIVSFGRAIGLNTAGMTVGRPVYVATTAGGITKDKPTGATDLIQNIGIVSVVDGTNGVIKVTGVGRSNDIPNKLEVVDSVVVGDTVISQTDAKLANVDANHILISTATSATSSIASATLFGDYVKSVNSETPTGGNVSLTTDNIPTAADKNYITGANNTKLGHLNVTATVDLNAIKPTDLAGTTANNNIITRNTNSTFASIAIGTGASTFLGNDFYGTPEAGSTLQYVIGESTGWSATTPTDVVNFVDFQGGGQIDHGSNLSGLNDDDHTQYVLSAGSRAMSALTVTNGITAATVSATNVSADGLCVNRVGQGRPTKYRWECDYLTPGTTQNGWGSHTNNGSPAGTGATIAAHFSDMINTVDYGVGVLELRSGTGTNGRSMLTTYNNVFVPSAMAFNLSHRLTMQDLYSSGSNEGYVIVGIADNGGNATKPTRGLYFRYDHTSTDWQAIATTAFSTETVSGTGVAVTEETFQVLQIIVDEDWTKAQYFIDGSLVATMTLADGHEIPQTGQMGLQIKIVNTNGGAGNDVWLDWHVYELSVDKVDRGEDYIKAGFV
jgi:hypothetical protein